MVRETGGPEVLRLEDVEPPQPGDGEALIRVRAASVNPIDWKYRRGLSEKPLPAILGIDVSGTVEISNVEGFAPGDDVFGFAGSGAYAELATAAAGAIVTKPPGLSHEQAAALPVSALTAWQALYDVGGLQRGQTALIAGAAGGVGHLAVQFAHYAGARVIGTGSARNRDFVLGLGADEYVDYTLQDVTEAVSGAVVVFDTVGGETTASLVGAVAEGGIIVAIASAPPTEGAAQRAARAELLISRTDADQLAHVAALVEAGDVRVEIAEILPLDEVARAHELSESGHVRGKLVLTV
jgi:NADPH:quinone reductase-like Zn-dependent oxidoreductase